MTQAPNTGKFKIFEENNTQKENTKIVKGWQYLFLNFDVNVEDLINIRIVYVKLSSFKKMHRKL